MRVSPVAVGYLVLTLFCLASFRTHKSCCHARGARVARLVHTATAGILYVCINVIAPSANPAPRADYQRLHLPSAPASCASTAGSVAVSSTISLELSSMVFDGRSAASLIQQRSSSGISCEV